MADAGDNDRFPWKFTVTVPFPSNRHAQIAHQSLKVDQEPRKGEISRKFTVDDRFLTVDWEATEARLLRVSVNSLFDMLKLVVQTIEKFDVKQS